MDFTLDEKTNAHILKLRHFIKKELQPLEDEVEATGILDSSLAAEILEKSRALGFYGMNIPVEHGGGGFNSVQMVYLEQEMGQTTDPLIRQVSAARPQWSHDRECHHHMGRQCSGP